mmetsp:Transcript_40414/g.108244  ORF Transcript_40414/g.108244 Transcript_40414/m.108244 type:complete len:90 (+) Transcript_40414:229-498(+)
MEQMEATNIASASRWRNTVNESQRLHKRCSAIIGITGGSTAEASEATACKEAASTYLIAMQQHMQPRLDAPPFPLLPFGTGCPRAQQQL